VDGLLVQTTNRHGKPLSSTSSLALTPPPVADQVERAHWQQLAPALRNLLTSSSSHDIAAVAAKAAHQLCDADAVSFGDDCTFRIDSDSDPDQVVTSITIAVPGPRPGPAMTVNWYTPHTVSEADSEVLEILAQAAVLALRALPARSASQPTAAFHHAERARFFDRQRQVRGLFAVVRSIVRRMAESSDSVQEYAAHLEGRLGAIARVQGFLLRAPGASVDLEELVHSEFLAQSIEDEKVRIAGPLTLLNPKTAETLGLALHELVINSIKFGALARAEGRVRVVWQREPAKPECVLMQWHESAGESVPRNVIKGCGFELIERMLPYELGGTSTITLDASGLHCMITFVAPPADAKAPAAE
jgi:two-component sensor histidine kinase